MGQIRYSDDAIVDLQALRVYIALNNPSGDRPHRFHLCSYLRDSTLVQPVCHSGVVRSKFTSSVTSCFAWGMSARVSSRRQMKQ